MKEKVLASCTEDTGIHFGLSFFKYYSQNNLSVNYTNFVLSRICFWTSCD